MRRGRPITGCGLPRWITTKRGQRCVATCDSGLWQFKPGSACATTLGSPELIGTYTEPDLRKTGRKAKRRRSRRK